MTWPKAAKSSLVKSTRPRATARTGRARRRGDVDAVVERGGAEARVALGAEASHHAALDRPVEPIAGPREVARVGLGRAPARPAALVLGLALALEPGQQPLDVLRGLLQLGRGGLVGPALGADLRRPAARAAWSAGRACGSAPRSAARCRGSRRGSARAAAGRPGPAPSCPRCPRAACGPARRPSRRSPSAPAAGRTSRSRAGTRAPARRPPCTCCAGGARASPSAARA